MIYIAAIAFTVSVYCSGFYLGFKFRRDKITDFYHEKWREMISDFPLCQRCDKSFFDEK